MTEDPNKLPPGLTEFLRDFKRVETTIIRGYEPSIQASNPSRGSANPPGPTPPSTGNGSGSKPS